MKFVFEKDEVNSEQFSKLVEDTLSFYRSTLKRSNDDIELTSVNMYVSAKTSEGNIITGLIELGNTWLIKPADFQPLTPTGEMSKSKKYANCMTLRDFRTNEDYLKFYYSHDYKQD